MDQGGEVEQNKKAANNLLQLFKFRMEALKNQRNQGLDEAAEFHSQIKMLEIQVDEMKVEAERNINRIELLEEEMAELHCIIYKDDEIDPDYEPHDYEDNYVGLPEGDYPDDE
tara:strand:+ start:2741 stop:3079 length:339 start_codon:yes stop_codon:yes gene_type:complete